MKAAINGTVVGRPPSLPKPNVHLPAMTEKSVYEEDEKMLMETGRLASRLIHDFKNQLGGMKLYASYLKKRFADQPEGVEVAEKIIQGLNEMAEQASLVSRLTRPIEMRRESGDLGQFLEMLASSLKPQAAAREVAIALDLAPKLPEIGRAHV